MIDILLAWILQCVMIPDFDEFSMCIDNVVLEYNMSLEWANLEMY
jgi:hypothetical protein